MSADARRLRVLIHAQHLSGVGHFVRLHEVGRALAERHDVHLIDGGRPVPRADGGRLRLLEVPRIERGAAGLVRVADGAPAGAAMAARQAILLEAAAALRPDVLVIEHYPFSKWQLAAEIDALIAGVRRASPGARVVCSVRDIPAQTRHEELPPGDWARAVRDRLHASFDAVMVHGEVELTPLVAAFPLAGSLRLPVVHTGIVAEAPPAGTAAPAADGAPYVVASVGGGRDAVHLEANCVAAWRLLGERGATGGRRLVVCGGLRDAGERTDVPGVIRRGFDSRFPAWLAAADLSVSYAGYNTCAGLIQARLRAVLVPNPRMSDQPARALLMSRLAGATVVAAAELGPERLAAAIGAALAGPRPAHGVTCDGAARAAGFIEQVAS